ncbi:hypothetical protein EDC01DRAFT_775249 [Geopyxis carbonaria]|nr:hypothetical protein EDC01DRAFT_775249 [Geopyxis carbonaria]
MTDSAALFQIQTNHLLINAEITNLCRLRYRLTDAVLSAIQEHQGQQGQHEARWGVLLEQRQRHQNHLAGFDRAGDVLWIPVLVKEAENVAALGKLRRRLQRLERERARGAERAERAEMREKAGGKK